MLTKKQCPVCKKYLAMKLAKQNKNWFFWICKFCGFQRKHERSWVIFKHLKDGKTLMKINNWHKFHEVELLKTKTFIQVVPKNLLE